MTLPEPAHFEDQISNLSYPSGTDLDLLMIEV